MLQEAGVKVICVRGAGQNISASGKKRKREVGASGKHELEHVGTCTYHGFAKARQEPTEHLTHIASLVMYREKSEAELHYIW